jgi:hypothetical protein
MRKNKEPIILSKDKICRIYITLDTIYTPLTSVVSSDNKDNPIYVKTYRVTKANIDVCSLKHEYAVEQLIYRITGMCCNVYDNMLARACICLTKHTCCHAWTERKQNFIILPDSDLLPANLYWITVFELVYKLKYPQSNNINKCFVYALNCMLKAGMMTIDDCINADIMKPKRCPLLYTYSLHDICTYLKGNKLRIPKSVHRYYKIFGKRLKRKYKKDQMPGGHVFHLPKQSDANAVAEVYTDAICKCIKLNQPIEAEDITKRKNSKAQFADVRQMKYNIDPSYVCAYLYVSGEPARDCHIYSNPWSFVKHSMLQRDGATSSVTHHIYLASEYFIENTIVENSIRLLFTLYHECAHVYHWRAIRRYNSMSSIEAHLNKKCGVTHERHAHKFALWHLIMNDISIEIINSAISNWCNTMCTITRGSLTYSHQVLFRYCRWLSYLNSKYGKLYIPIDLRYIFVNRKTGKLYKPNDEIKCIN